MTAAAAVAGMAGVIATTEPGGKPISAPYTPDLTGADGPLPQPWYQPVCGQPTLQLVSHTLQASAYTFTNAYLLLTSDDFDLTFTVDYSVDNGNNDDTQVHFRVSACAPTVVEEHWAVTTNPHANNLVALVHFVNNSPSFPVVNSAGLTEGSTHTWRIVVSGTSLTVYLDGSSVISYTISALSGQRAINFTSNHPGTKFRAISLA